MSTPTDILVEAISERVVEKLRAAPAESTPAVPRVLYTAKEAGEALGIPESAVRRLIKERKLPKHPNLGTNIRIPVEAVRRFAEGRG